MKIGYARVSTEEQTVALQVDALRAAGCARIFQDEAISGATRDRPGLAEALAVAADGDVLVVWKLDRLGRSLPHLIKLMQELDGLGVGFQSLSENIDTATAGGKLFFHMMGALAEFERDLISERTKAGMKAAKMRGKHVGRPQAMTGNQIAHARALIEAGQETHAGAAALFGVHAATLRRALRTT